MNREEIQRLQSMRQYPSVSILMPTHRSAPDNRQDPIRLRNLVKAAGDRLLQQLQRREVESVLARLEREAEELDFSHLQEGLAVFANRDFSGSYTLPFPVRERVVVDEAFATRDLVLARNRSARYWALVLSEKPTRLYEGFLGRLVEVEAAGFPMVHEGPGGEAPLPFGYGVRKSAVRDEHHRQFFRQVDAAFGKVAAAEPGSLPLVLVGVDRYLAFFDEVTRHGEGVIGRVHGSHDKTSPHDLAPLVWPLVQEELARRRERVLGDLEQALKAGRSASGIVECWRQAAEGRGRVLLVEEGFQCPARVDGSGLVLEPVEDPAPPEVMDDAVDELIERVLSKGGEVVFVEDGRLAKHQSVALTLRY